MKDDVFQLEFTLEVKLSRRSKKRTKRKEAVTSAQGVIKLGSKDFRKLQAHWYARLKEDGFEDLEYFHPDGEAADTLLDKHKIVRADRAPEVMEHTAEFYRLCGLFLHDYAFESELDRNIWELFTEGTTYRAIASRLKISMRKTFQTITRLRTGAFEEYRKGLHAEQGPIV